MTYSKPTIATTDTSLTLVQSGGTNKSNNTCVDHDNALHQAVSSAGAYEVDE